MLVERLGAVLGRLRAFGHSIRLPLLAVDTGQVPSERGNAVRFRSGPVKPLAHTDVSGTDALAVHLRVRRPEGNRSACGSVGVRAGLAGLLAKSRGIGPQHVVSCLRPAPEVRVAAPWVAREPVVGHRALPG